MVVNKTEIKENRLVFINETSYSKYAVYAEFIDALNGKWISSNHYRRTSGFGSILQLRFKLNGIGWSTSAICHGLKCFVHLGLAVPGQNGQTCRNIGLLERTESNIFLSHLLVNRPFLLTFRIFFLKGWSMGVTTF